MAVPFIFFLCVFSHLFLLYSAGEDNLSNQCPQSFTCGTLNPPLEFPYSNSTYPDCGLCEVNCSYNRPFLYFDEYHQYEVEDLNFTNRYFFKVGNKWLGDLIRHKNCDFIACWNPLNTSSVSFSYSPNLTVFKCMTGSPELRGRAELEFYFRSYSSYKDCPGYTLFFNSSNIDTPPPGSYPSACSVIQVPVKLSTGKRDPSDLFSLLSDEFDIQLHVAEECLECHHRGGRCSSSTKEEFYCLEKKENKQGRKLIWVLGTVILGGILLVLCFLILVIHCRKKWKYASTKNTSSDPSSKAGLEGGIAYFGVPLFSYSDLEEATNNFSPSEELGDGGFGTVYHGRLRDGREVAVKRLYEHNYKRMTHFTNEIQILTRLSHPNLVSLYGCTSSRSRELLLVYEYVANGTVADHLYGARANDNCLTWPIRMNIAMETASALAYLHNSGIVHRDVKTNNILIDLNFHVKVADFGLSRLFPNDVTHVSTAPQGTPGYVDPEYHQCYQLTDRSDVYSFGVVLIELISSKPAVDITRHKHEINLANYAVNRIQNRAFHELIDPSLGLEFEWTVMAVAEVAFRCLQLEKELRPTMTEVLEALKDIQEHKEEDTKANDNVGRRRRARAWSEGDDDIVLLKNIKAATSSPDSVTDKWLCCSSTSVSSG